MHKSPTEVLSNAQWRVTTALRLGLVPDAGPRATCALRNGIEGECVNVLLGRTHTTLFVAGFGRVRSGPHRAVLCSLRRLIEQAGSYADIERRSGAR